MHLNASFIEFLYFFNTGVRVNQKLQSQVGFLQHLPDPADLAFAFALDLDLDLTFRRNIYNI